MKPTYEMTVKYVCLHVNFFTILLVCFIKLFSDTDFINMFLLKYEDAKEYTDQNHGNVTKKYECIRYPLDLKDLPCSSQTIFYDNQV